MSTSKTYDPNTGEIRDTVMSEDEIGALSAATTRHFDTDMTPKTIRAAARERQLGHRTDYEARARAVDNYIEYITRVSHRYDDERRELSFVTPAQQSWNSGANNFVELHQAFSV